MASMEKFKKGLELIHALKKLDQHGNMLEGNLDVVFMISSTASYVDLSENMLASSDSNQKFLLQLYESESH